MKYFRPVSLSAVDERASAEADEILLNDLRVNFVKSNQTTFRDISDALEAGDAKLAHRLAHTLKGVAGLVGMTSLSRAALVVEQSLSSGKQELLSGQLTTLEKELNTALEELTLVMNSHADNTAKHANAPFDKDKTLELLGRLDLSLESDSFDSVNLVSELNAIPGLEQLASQVENLKFKQARQTLAAIRLRLENGA